MADYSMQDTFKIEGRWGLPSWGQEKWLRGYVEHSPEEGIRLVVEGSFEPRKPMALGVKASVSYEVIHGVSDDFRKVTLLQSLGYPLPNFGEQMRQKYQPRWMAVGEHVSALDCWKYPWMAARYHGLEEFVGFPPLSCGFNEAGDTFSVIYKRPQSVAADLGEFEICTEYRGCFPVGSYFEITNLRPKAWLVSRSKSSAKVLEFLSEPFHSFGRLLDLGAGRHLPMTALRAGHGSLDIEFGVQIFFSQRRAVPVRGNLSAVSRQPDGFSFTLANFGADAGEYIKRWHQTSHRCSGAIGLYFSLDPEEDTDIQTDYHFVSLAVALESYHAVTHSQCPDCKSVRDKREERRTRILSKVPVEALDSNDCYALEAALKNGLNPSFLERIRELYDRQCEQVRRILGDKDKFCMYVRDARNAFTHKGRACPDAEGEVIELWRATKKLRLMMQALFLMDMGVSDERMLQILGATVEAQILA